MYNLEILAPVGSIESLYAAVENGANAVYLGGKIFNARAYASNFDDDELKKAVEYAHIRNVKVYVTLNILLDNKEISEVIDYLVFLYNIDVDAVIIQDLGLGRIIKNLLPDFEIHGSTQMTVHNHIAVNFLEELGFNRVVLSRELSIEEIRYIKDNSNIELEGFVHGALCVSYSGQCLMSSIIGGRSGNRGRCAQPCRMPYSIVDNLDNTMGDDYIEKFLISPKDLNTIDYVDKIIDSGISSLKIEGRMKSPGYVSVIVDRYKKAIEGIDNNKIKITERDKRDIAQMFNRGFTKGHILSDERKNFISYDRPNNRGVNLGEVVKIDDKFIYIKLDHEVNKGDGIQFVGKNNLGLILDKIYIKNDVVKESKKNQTIKIKKIKGVSLGDKVNKTYDINLNKTAEDTYKDRAKLNKIPIFMAIDITLGQTLKLHLWDNINYITVESERIVELGKNMVLTEEKVKEQLGKLGDTPYNLENIEVKLDPGIMVPISVLNNTRRKAIDKLNKSRSNKNNRDKISINDLEKSIEDTLDFPGNSKASNSRKMSVMISDNNQFKRLDLNKLDRVYLNLTQGVEELIKEGNSYNKEIFLYSDRIVESTDFNKYKKLLDKIDLSKISGISVSDLGSLKFIKDNYDTKVHCDYGLNIFNTSSVKLLKDYGVKSVTLSPELKMSQLEDICRSEILEYETIAYGYLPVMITKYCPMAIVKKCSNNSDCSKCIYSEGYGLKDRKNMTFDLERRGNKTLIYNSQPLMVAEHLNEIYNIGVNITRLNFTKKGEEIEDIINIYYDYINNNIDLGSVKDFVRKYKDATGITKGHYFRGVL